MRTLVGLLMLAITALVVQLFLSTLSVFDLRSWSQDVWFVANSIVVLGLDTVRYGPDLYAHWLERRRRIAIGNERARESAAVQEQRELIERHQRGRSGHLN